MAMTAIDYAKWMELTIQDKHNENEIVFYAEELKPIIDILKQPDYKKMWELLKFTSGDKMTLGFGSIGRRVFCLMDEIEQEIKGEK